MRQLLAIIPRHSTLRSLLATCLMHTGDWRIPTESTTECEVKDFPDRLRKLIKALENLVAPGGPHPGPAPRTTTEMVLEIMTALVKGVG